MPVNLESVQYSLYKRALAEAERRMKDGDPVGAASAYRRSADALKHYAQTAATPPLKKQWLDKAQSYLDLAGKIDSGQYKVLSRPQTGAEGDDGNPPEDDYPSVVAGLVVRSGVTWDDIGGLGDTKTEIKNAYGMSVAQKPVGVKLKGWRNILLYGPAGTGKTLLAAATSNGLEATFFNAKLSELLSKYFGESSKILSALYALARIKAPSVVFLDEINALCVQREKTDSGAEQRIVNTFLTELDGLEGKGEERYVLTIGATNLPWLLDRAILSRFEKRIFVPLPDAAARRSILRIQIDKAGHRSLVPTEELVQRTEGYSGREIERLCRQAIQHMVAQENPSLTDLVDQGKQAVQNYRIRVRQLGAHDFDHAFERIVPETRAEDMLRFAQWQSKHST